MIMWHCIHGRHLITYIVTWIPTALTFCVYWKVSGYVKIRMGLVFFAFLSLISKFVTRITSIRLVHCRFLMENVSQSN